MKPLEQMSKENTKAKNDCFDVDGVLVPQEIKQEGNTTTWNTKVILKKQIEQIRKLSKMGFLINISSDGVYMLQEMFRNFALCQP